jgi:hypothetical protein
MGPVFDSCVAQPLVVFTPTTWLCLGVKVNSKLQAINRFGGQDRRDQLRRPSPIFVTG